LALLLFPEVAFFRLKFSRAREDFLFPKLPVGVPHRKHNGALLIYELLRGLAFDLPSRPIGRRVTKSACSYDKGWIVALRMSWRKQVIPGQPKPFWPRTSVQAAIAAPVAVSLEDRMCVAPPCVCESHYLPPIIKERRRPILAEFSDMSRGISGYSRLFRGYFLSMIEIAKVTLLRTLSIRGGESGFLPGPLLVKFHNSGVAD